MLKYIFATATSGIELHTGRTMIRQSDLNRDLCILLCAQDLSTESPLDKSQTPLPKVQLLPKAQPPKAQQPKAPLAGPERGELAHQRLQRQQQDGSGIHVATASAPEVAAASVPSPVPTRAVPAAGAIRTSPSTAAIGTPGAGACAATTVAASPAGGSAGASSLLPFLMDSLPFMVTVIAQSSTRVLYQNGPSKAYHGAYNPETAGAGDDLLRDLFAMSQEGDRDELLKVCGIIG